MAWDTARRTLWRLFATGGVVAAISVGIAFFVYFLRELSASNAGEIAGALGSILGGIIGASGAAAAVYLTLAGQRQEERVRIRAAIVREVIELSRFVVGHLDLYENIRSGQTALPTSKLVEAHVIPQPTIYPAIADRIGLLPSPQNVVAFYCRISEIIMILVPAISSNLASENRNLTASDVYVLIEPSIFLLELARGIIDGSYETFDDAVQRSILFDIERTSTQARQTFEIPQ